MKANVAWSIEEDAIIAGKNIAKKAVLDLNETKIAFLFSSVKYNTEKLLEGTKEVMGTAPVIGCTSCDGLVCNDGYISSQNGFAGMLAIGDEETKVITAGVERKRNIREAGKEVAQIALEKANCAFMPAYFYMIATPGDEEEYLKGIQDVIGDVPCFGGSMADDNMSAKWRMYTEEKVIHDGVVVAFFYTNKDIVNLLDGRYHETINSGVIRDVEGKRQLNKIDKVDALRKYCEWTNTKMQDVKGMKLSVASVLKPIGIKTYNGDSILIRHPLNGNTDGSINIGNDIAVNTVAIQMQSSKEEMIVAPQLVARELKSKLRNEPAAYIIMHSASRKKVLEGKVDEMSRKLKAELGDVPFIMPFTYGEYGRAKYTGNLCGGLMISGTAICK